jgi:hypothetical protein
MEVMPAMVENIEECFAVISLTPGAKNEDVTIPPRASVDIDSPKAFRD